MDVQIAMKAQDMDVLVASLAHGMYLQIAMKAHGMDVLVG